MLAEGAVGALAARGDAIQAVKGRRETKQDEISGATDAISQDESFSGPDRVWDIEFPMQSDALPDSPRFHGRAERNVGTSEDLRRRDDGRRI